MSRAYTWDQLARRSLARQFPRVRGRGPGAVAETIRRIGPIQSQTARSPFLAIAARLPGATHEAITSAYEQFTIVRGSTMRGTVHTTAAEQHPLTEVATRIGQRALWHRSTRPERTGLEALWQALEEFAGAGPRTREELATFLHRWVGHHESPQSAAVLQTAGGTNWMHGHGGLLRAPLQGRWDAQVAYGLGAARTLLDDAVERDAALADTTGSMTRLVRLYLRGYGPATRADIAWWAGTGLRPVDAALQALQAETTVRLGPDGAQYWDLADGVARPVGDVGTRLLPEFDALLVGYHPKVSRARFIDPEHHAVLWNQANALLLPPVLHRGRIVGYWRLNGTGRRRRLQVFTFDGLTGPAVADLEQPVAAMGAALDAEIVLESVGTHFGERA